MEKDFSPIDEAGYCFADIDYSKAYLRHLFISKEMLAAQLATLHNLSFYLWLVTEARKRINDGIFISWKNSMVKKLVSDYNTLLKNKLFVSYIINNAFNRLVLITCNFKVIL